MTSFTDLQSAEPAFIAKNTKQLSQRRSQQIEAQKSMHDCCFSLCNLILIVASITAIVFSVKFLFDEVLYEHGEHLLSLRFYRQIIYIIVILPLVLLVPLFNALVALFLSDKLRYELSGSLSTVKLVYEIVMGILVFVGLAFVASYIRQSSVSAQLSHELRGHMKRRYDNDFSYEFLDSIQQEYECCDELWYRSNYVDRLPISCFLPDGQYSNLYERDCADVIGSLVANRCTVIAICLVLLFVALCALIGIDLMELLTHSRNQYDVGVQETKLQSTTNLERIRGSSPRRFGLDSDNEDDDNDHSSGHAALSTSSGRLRAAERERESPLLANKSRSQQWRPEEEEEDDWAAWRQQPQRDVPGQQRQQPQRDVSGQQRQHPQRDVPGQPTPILTRANYLNYSHRPQSPLFLGDGSRPGSSLQPEVSAASDNFQPKSVLKKGPSTQRINLEEPAEEQEEEVHIYHRELQRELQTRRSLLNVRFAE